MATIDNGCKFGKFTRGVIYGVGALLVLCLSGISWYCIDTRAVAATNLRPVIIQLNDTDARVHAQDTVLGRMDERVIQQGMEFREFRTEQRKDMRELKAMVAALK